MNLSTLIGIIAAIAVFIGSILTSSNNSKIFLNMHALVIVIGGTFAAALISYPFEQIWDAQKIIFKKVIGKFGVKNIDLIKEIISIAEGYSGNSQYIIQNIDKIKYPFLKEGLTLLIEETMSPEKLDNLLRKRAEIIFLEYESEAHIFKSMSRFPPAFGLLGAVMGMVSLMQGLGSPDSFKQIGPAMAMALVATLYGIAFANFVLIPLSENLSKLNKQDAINRSIVLDAIKLIRQREHHLIIEENLNSYLKPSARFENRNKAA